MGRRRKKVSRILKRRLPHIYLCPNCGKDAIKVELFKDQRRASVRCGSCGLTNEFSIKPALQEIDAYCHFTDSFYSGKL